MKKIKSFFIIIFFTYTVFLFSQEKIDDTDYKEFLKLNAGYTEAEDSFLTKQSIIKYEKNLKPIYSDSSYCLFHKNGQCVQIKSKNKIQYFFSSDQGYWLYNKNLKTPLKISGSYKIEEFEIQDILKTNFKADYKLISYEDGIFTLERQNQKAVYKFIFLAKKDKNIFELQFTDVRKVPIRKLVYHVSVVDGYLCFKKIDVYNLIFDKDSYSSWITENVRKVDISSSLFSFSQIKHLTQRMEGLILNGK